MNENPTWTNRQQSFGADIVILRGQESVGKIWGHLHEAKATADNLCAAVNDAAALRTSHARLVEACEYVLSHDWPSERSVGRIKAALAGAEKLEVTP